MRRILIGTVSAIALLVAACAQQTGTTGTTTTTAEPLQAAVTDIGIFATSLPAIASGLTGVLNADQNAQASKYVAALTAANTALQAAPPITTADTNLQNAELAINGVMSIFNSLPAGTVPASIAPEVAAAEVLVGVLEGVANTYAALPAPGASAMTPDRARQVLRSAHR